MDLLFKIAVFRFQELGIGHELRSAVLKINGVSLASLLCIV